MEIALLLNLGEFCQELYIQACRYVVLNNELCIMYVGNKRLPFDPSISRKY